MLKIKEVRGTVSLDGCLNVHIVFTGVNNATTVCEALSAVNAACSGDILAGSLGFISLASKIYTAIKSGK